MKKKTKALIGAAIMAGFLFGCKKKEENVIDGGVIDNSSYDAPKIIESKDIIELSTQFYLEYDKTADDDYSGFYDFEIKDGVLTSAEPLKFTTEVTTDLINQIQNIIDNNSLVELNGTDKHTSGLAPEYQPCYFTAVYQSGEKLYFSTNNNPYAKWAKELFELIRETAINNGHTEFEPSIEASTIEKFQLEFSDENGSRIYSEITENDTQKLSRYFYSADDETTHEDFVIIPEDFYQKTAELIKSTNLLQYENEDYYDSGISVSICFFELYADYKNGKQLYGRSNNEEYVKQFIQDCTELIQYLDSLYN